MDALSIELRQASTDSQQELGAPPSHQERILAVPDCVKTQLMVREPHHERVVELARLSI
jgi:hypothetical protein